MNSGEPCLLEFSSVEMSPGPGKYQSLEDRDQKCLQPTGHLGTPSLLWRGVLFSYPTSCLGVPGVQHGCLPLTSLPGLLCVGSA